MLSNLPALFRTISSGTPPLYCYYEVPSFLVVLKTSNINLLRSGARETGSFKDVPASEVDFNVCLYCYVLCINFSLFVCLGYKPLIFSTYLCHVTVSSKACLKAKGILCLLLSFLFSHSLLKSFVQCHSNFSISIYFHRKQHQ